MPPRTRRRLHPAAAKAELNVNIPKEDSLPRTSTPARPKPTLASLPTKHTAPSSLPPSSPPPPTSSLEHTHESNLPSKDDPFGFFATERRLKARTTVRKPRVPRNHDEEAVLAILGVQSNNEPAIPHSESDQDDGNDDRPAFATPPHANNSSDLELDLNLSATIGAGTKTPTAHTPDPHAATPRQRRRKTKLPTAPTSRSSSPDPSHDSGSYPQTPSPRKRARSARRPLSDVKPQDNTPRKTAASQAVKKTRKTDETLAEEQVGGVTKELTGLLPRRPTRKAAQRKSTAPAKATAAVAAPKKRGTKASKPRSKKAAIEGDVERELVGEREGESFVLNGDEREQFEIDRAARQAYFKKLDDYVMEEESVYIV